MPTTAEDWPESAHSSNPSTSTSMGVNDFVITVLTRSGGLTVLECIHTLNAKFSSLANLANLLYLMYMYQLEFATLQHVHTYILSLYFCPKLFQCSPYKQLGGSTIK